MALSFNPSQLSDPNFSVFGPGFKVGDALPDGLQDWINARDQYQNINYGSSDGYIDKPTGISFSGLGGGLNLQAGGDRAAKAGNDSLLNGFPHAIYDSQGNTQGPLTWQGLENDGGAGMQFLTAASMMLPGMGATMAGVGAAGAAAGAGAGFGSGGLGSTFADLAASNVIPQGSAFLPATAGDMASMGLGGSGFGGSLGNLFNKGVSGLTNKAIGSAIPKILGIGGGMQGMGGGQSNGNNNSGGGMDLGNFNLGGLANLIPGIGSAITQGNASNNTLNWLQGQQGKIDNLYNPGSAEYNSLFDQMSRQDAAAGRNSQIGPRSVDLAGRIAQIKADATARLTSGIAGARSDAVNQGANRFSGLAAGLGQGGGIGGTLNSLFGGGGGGAGTGNFLSQLFGGTNSSTGVPFDVIPQGVPFTPSSGSDVNDMINGDVGGFDLSDWFL